MQVLTDAQWAKLEAAIKAAKSVAPVLGEDRRTIEAIIWRLDNGAKWRSIPAELCDWHHAYLRFRRWAVRGVWDQIMGHWSRRGSRNWRLPALTGRSRVRIRRRPGPGPATPRPKTRLSLRLTRGSRSEALGRSRGGLGTKIIGVCDAVGRLVDFLLAPGQAHELTPSLTLLHRLS